MGDENSRSSSCLPEEEIPLESPMKKFGIRNGDPFVDLETGGGGALRRKRSARNPKMSAKPHPLIIFCFSLCFGTFLLLLLAVYNGNLRQVAPQLSAVRRIVTAAPYPYGKLRNLVMVAGHSVYTGGKGGDCGDKGDGEAAWYLEAYQRHPGQAATFVEHIRAGVESAAADGGALLLFSGGETRRDAGPRSEAQSYWSVAEAHDWFGKQTDVRHRSLTEEHARDSFENLLFSICRFRELTGSYPHNITVVSYDFKQKRFANLHRSALRFPAFRFFYVGTPASPPSVAAALKGEALVREQFQKDPYGCSGSLRMKRIGRDPFHRSIPYPNGCPELGGLFEYCGSTLYSEKLPWDD